jgi:hypothetical protein
MSIGKQVFSVAVAALLAACIPSLILLRTDAGAQIANNKPIPLMDYLARVGKDHDCFFYR